MPAWNSRDTWYFQWTSIRKSDKIDLTPELGWVTWNASQLSLSCLTTSCHQGGNRRHGRITSSFCCHDVSIQLSAASNCQLSHSSWELQLLVCCHLQAVTIQLSPSTCQKNLTVCSHFKLSAFSCLQLLLPLLLQLTVSCHCPFCQTGLGKGSSGQGQLAQFWISSLHFILLCLLNEQKYGQKFLTKFWTRLKVSKAGK